jgi:hypothetical protein
MHAEADVHAFLAVWREIMAMVSRDEIPDVALIGDVKVDGKFGI